MSKLAHSNEETMKIIEENDERHLSEERVDRKELTPTRIGYVDGDEGRRACPHRILGTLRRRRKRLTGASATRRQRQ